MIKWLKNWLQARRSGLLLEDKPKGKKYVVSGSTLEETVDLRQYFLPCRNQGFDESCTGFATGAVIEYWLVRSGNVREYVSPAYFWVYGKDRHGWLSENKGVFLGYTLDVVYEEGFVLEKTLPYKSENLYKLPVGLGVALSVPMFWLKNYTEKRVINSLQLKDCLSKGWPVVCGLHINKSFYGNSTGIINGDLKTNGLSHAMIVVGYTKDYFILRNSWGDDWGDEGYCYVPQKYFHDNSTNLFTIIERQTNK